MIRIDERLTGICAGIEDMKDDFDARMEEQKATIDNVTMLIDEQLTDADKRISKLEKWKTQTKTTYGIIVAVASFVLYIGVTCIVKYWM